MQRQVPRRAGGHHGLPRELGVDDPQRPQVGCAPVQGRQQREVVARHLRDVLVPLHQTPRRLAPPGVGRQQRAGHDLGAPEDRRHGHRDGVPAAGGDDRLPPQRRRLWADGARAGDPAADPRRAAPPHQQHLVGVGAARFDLVLVAEAAVAGGGERRQIRRHLDLDLDVARLGTGVPHLDLVAQAGGHEAPPHDHRPGGPGTGRRGAVRVFGRDGPPDERRRRGAVHPVIHRGDAGAVHRHDQARQHPPVADEQARRCARATVDDVARGVGDTERARLDEGHEGARRRDPDAHRRRP